MNRHSIKPAYHVNLVRLQQVCEENYQRLIRLLPELSHQDHCRLPVNHHKAHASHGERLIIDVIERAPFTTLLQLKMESCRGQLFKAPEAEVRLYHDVQMAEVITRKTSQIIQPRYDYPNEKMHQPNEKELHNQFLAQWLDYALPICRSYYPAET